MFTLASEVFYVWIHFFSNASWVTSERSIPHFITFISFSNLLFVYNLHENVDNYFVLYNI